MNAQVEEIISELNYALALPFVTIEQKSIVRDEINRIHKKALASLKQPAQEPVAWRVLIDEAPQDTDWFYMTGQCWDVFKRFAEALYTHPVTWQSLSDDEIVWLCPPFYDEDNLIANEFGFARAIEAKLKEKNT